MAPHPSPEKPKLGRPQNMAKRESIVLAAHILMFEAKTPFTMEAVAARAGVSKQTVYNVFPRKEDLLRHVVRLTVDDITRDLREEPDTTDIRIVLGMFGKRYLDMLSIPGRTGFIRMMIEAAGRGDEMAEVFYNSGPGFARTQLSNFLIRQQRLGKLHCENVDLAVEQFFGLILGTVQMQYLLGVSVPFTPEIRAKRIAEAIRVFLLAYEVR
jgi:TetR/AcrR family transcriptional regulator, mexJK operon transcriptional repressor